MRLLAKTGPFKRDYKRQKKAAPDLDDVLLPTLKMIIEGDPLPRKFADHPLGGNWTGHRDCHLKPDLLLIYKLSDDKVTLVRLGSHSDIFG